MKRTERFALMFEPEAIKRIDDYRHAKRISSRARAVRELIDKGLASEGIATTGSEFGDQNPVEAGNSTDQEIGRAHV